jgi:hypothetical protein
MYIRVHRRNSNVNNSLGDMMCPQASATAQLQSSVWSVNAEAMHV